MSNFMIQEHNDMQMLLNLALTGTTNQHKQRTKVHKLMTETQNVQRKQLIQAFIKSVYQKNNFLIS